MNNDLPINIRLPEGFLREEVRSGYRVTSEIKKVWAVEIDLLAELLRICNKHGLQVFSDGGTTLGAIRHKGFIPWDDDIDMVMMRDQYEKLCEVAPFECKPPYFFQTEYTDPGSLRGHAQLRNSKTTGILKSELDKRYSFNQGIFIDIFPMDAAPDDTQSLSEIQQRTTDLITASRRKARYTTRYYASKNIFKRPVKGLAHLICSRIPTFNGQSRRLYELYEKECARYNGESTGKVAKYFSISEGKKKQVWDRECFKKALDYPFEFISIPVPVGYEKIMDSFFGDWHTPRQVRSFHGLVIFDTGKSYSEYIGERRNKNDWKGR